MLSRMQADFDELRGGFAFPAALAPNRSAAPADQPSVDVR